MPTKPAPAPKPLPDFIQGYVNRLEADLKRNPYPPSGSWDARLLWALKVIPALVGTNHGLYGDDELDDVVRWEYPQATLEALGLVCNAVTEAALVIASNKALDQACPRECPDGLARWLLSLRDDVANGPPFALMNLGPLWEDVDVDVCLTALIRPVSTALEVALLRPTAIPAHTDHAPPSNADADGQGQEPALTKADRLTLCTLAKFDPSILASAAQIAEAMDLSERLSDRTITPSLRKLVKLNLAERPEGDRRGVRLTIPGRRMAPKIAD